MKTIPAWSIGKITLQNPLVLAPMAGVTDLPTRLIAREMGCALVYTEMISDKALVFGNKRTLEMLKLSDGERPVAVQLFGSEPGVMAEAASMVRELKPDIIDINMGCPTPKIVKNGEGAALMRKPDLAAAIVEAVVGVAGGIPVTVKMRKGWDRHTVNAVEVAKAVVEAGAAAVAVHGRTRDQLYSGSADWGIIASVKRAVNVPVIGNGDVREPGDVRRMLEETGCDGVMIGRGALGNPWIFRRSLHFLLTGEVLPGPGAGERIRMAIRHLRMQVDLKGERMAVLQMRKHIAWYLKGLRGASRVRDAINVATGAGEMVDILESFLASCGEIC
ncbi:MAG TPA: tRNA dihydrouridine synthase DusB [Firmicutes bacterium]|nr:tRNA dihydrouridine synthase DusB [Bacillota bacterium]